MNEGNALRGPAALPVDVKMALTVTVLLILQAEGWVLLGASGPGITPWMWLTAGAGNLALALSLSLGPLRERRPTRIGLLAAGLLVGAWVIPRSMLLGPLTYFSLLLLVPVAALWPATALLLSFARDKPRGSGPLAMRLMLSALLALVFTLSLVPSPRSVFWLDNYWAMNIGLRAAVESRVDLVELQSAAVELLEREGRKPTDDKPLRLFGAEIASSPSVPKRIRQLNPRSLVVVPRRNMSEPYVIIVWGGGLLHWGLYIGGPTYHKETGWRSGTTTRKWQNGIYGVFAF